MKKRLLAIVMMMGVLCPSVLCAYAADTNDAVEQPVTATENEGETTLWPEIMPLAMLYDESNTTSTTGSTRTSTFTATAGNGGIIRTWYRNDASLTAKVILYKYNSSTKQYKNVSNFTVGSGKGKWTEYKGTGASTGRYYVTVEAVGGKTVKGYLRVVQTTESLS
ncbi:MAG: hypothetical protein Q4D42_12155 [Eubacteriales bacterium]|nr:hypothetical protein [Eubacteriales bacterium]